MKGGLVGVAILFWGEAISLGAGILAMFLLWLDRRYLRPH